MDKYEFHVKTDQIKKLVHQKDYEAALKIAETIDWTKVKNMSLLTMISEVYEKNGKYEESIDYLMMVYDRYPAGRTVVYKLAELCILTGDYDEAINFYQEYSRIAPFDTSKDILKYKICKGKGKSIDKLIKILEDFKEKDYQEEWAYELAQLYHEAGRGDDCVSECDEIDLWFGEGTFVMKALELKLLYQPLTPIQMKKYENRFEYVEDGDALQEVDLSEQMISGFKVKTVSFDKYDTMNLQEELAKSMEQIMNAPDEETLDSTMKNVKKMVEDSNLKELIPEPVAYEKILETEDDGQLSLEIPEVNILDKQITGQLTIEEVMAEWERQMAAGQQALEESRVRRLDRARERALEETGNILERLADVLPLAEGDEEVLEDAMKGLADTADLVAAESEPEDFLDAMMDEVAEEPLIEDISLEEEATEEDGHVLDDMVEDLEESIAVDLLDLEATKEWVMPRDLIKDETEEEILPENPLFEPEEETQPADESKLEAAAVSEAPVTENEKPEESEKPVEEKEIAASKEPEMREKKPEAQKEKKPQLSEEQEEILSYFMEIPSVRDEIHNLGEDYPLEPLIVITGMKGTGKTSLATRIIKAAQLSDKSVGKRIAKTTGESINQKDIVQILEKMVQGSLIIEGAEELTKESLETLRQNLPKYKGRLQIYLLGEEGALEEALNQNQEFEKLCKKRIHLPVYKNQDLVVFAKAYAKTQKYSIDDMGVLALYTRLGVKQTEYHKVALDEVKEIIDEAIARSSKFTMKKFFGRLFSSRIDDEGMIILGEKDILEDDE